MAKELVYKIRIDYDTSQARRGGQAIEESQEEAAEATKKTTQQINRQAEAQEKASQSTRSYQRNQSRANQVLFSYGDLVNDAQQFQFGFSNGLRAIGNNVSFAAESISNLNTKAGGFRGTLKVLGKSLLGPGGIILGINVAVTALTVFGDKIFGTGKKLKELNEDLKTTRDFFESLSKEAVTEFVDQAETVDEKIAIIQDALDSLFLEEAGLKNLPVPVIRLNTATQDATNTINNQLQPAQESVVQELSQQELLQLSISKEVRDILINKKAELEAQKLINEFAEDRLSTEKDLNRITGVDRTARIGIETVGGETITPEQQRQIEARRKEIQKREQAIRRIEGRTAEVSVETERRAAQARAEVYRNLQDRKTTIQRIAESQRQQLLVQGVAVAGQLAGEVFGQSKELAIAQTLISTYAAAQKAYQSQMAIPTPDAPVRATAAAAVAVAQGLARLAAIRSAKLGGGGSGSGGGGGSRQTAQEGFRTGTIDRGQATSGIQGATGSTQPINITLQTEADNKIIRKKSMQGKKEIESSVTANVETD